MDIYDVGIIGAGIAGSFATVNLANKDVKCIVIDSGKAPLKRRHQVHGWLGCFPAGDGKLYLNDLKDLSEVVGTRTTNSAFNNVKSLFKDINQFDILDTKSPNNTFIKKINKMGYELSTTPYIQTIPKEIHALSKMMVKKLDSAKNIDYIFEEEIIDITKNKKIFNIQLEDQEIKCRKIILCIGRGGWRLAHRLYKKFGLVQENNIAKYGIRLETDAINLKELNNSNCTIIKKDQLELGPFSWGGTVIPEDHCDCAITSFRSNEKRWESEKVSFNLIGHIPVNNDAVEQIDRIAKLTFLIANDRVVRERLALLISKKSKLSIMKEYNWIHQYLPELNEMFPNLMVKSYFYFPTIIPMVSKINVNKNLESDLDGMYVAGESAGISGILGAACSGVIAANNIIK